VAAGAPTRRRGQQTGWEAGRTFADVAMDLVAGRGDLPVAHAYAPGSLAVQRSANARQQAAAAVAWGVPEALNSPQGQPRGQTNRWSDSRVVRPALW